MKTEWRRYAPVGLIVAAVALLAALGLYIYQGAFTLAVQVSLAMIVVGLALFILLDPDRMRVLLTGRQARYGSNALVLALAFIGILVVINYLVFQNNQRWDLTEDKQFTLAEETINALQSLPEPVTARAFYTSRTPSDTAADLLDQFEVNGDGKFSYEIVNPDENPLAAEQAGITQDGTIVMTMGERTQTVRFASEQELASGLLRLINPDSPSVYFLIGHGERSPEDSGEQGLSLAQRSLESKNYTVQTLNLLATNQIPEDADVIAIAGPTNPLTDGEVDMLKDFVGNGGALIVMLEPRPLTDLGDAVDPLAAYLGSDWGVEAGENLVVDLTSQQALAPFAASYGQHAITQPFATSTTSQFPTARSVRTAAEAPTNLSMVELVMTAQQSWAETDIEGLNEEPPRAAFDEGVDLPGPVSLAVAVENPDNQARLVVFGDSEFAVDAMFSAYANGDLLVNAVDWTVGQEDLINLTPKEQTSRVLLPPRGATIFLLYFGSVCLLPLLALFGGLGVFLQRRRRG